MFIVQVVGLFHCDTMLEAQDLANKCGAMLTDATTGTKGSVYAKVEQKDDATEMLEAAQEFVDAVWKVAN